MSGAERGGYYRKHTTQGERGGDYRPGERVVASSSVIGMLVRGWVLTAPVGATLIAETHLLGISSPFGLEIPGAVAAAAEHIYSLALGLWIVPAGAWIITHLFRPQDPLCFERLANPLIIVSFALYLVGLAMAAGG